MSCITINVWYPIFTMEFLLGMPFLGTGHLAPVNEESPVENLPSNSCNVESNQETVIANSESCEVRSDSREEENIIESMDSDTSIIRQRRVAFYNNWNNESRGIVTYIKFK